MSDLISRQAAISAICNACGKIDCDKMDKCEKLQLPPASCSEFPNNSDTISRQAAIDALKNRWKKTRNYEGIGDDIAEECELYLKQVPSAQPEIIRCKDCKRWMREYLDNSGKHGCNVMRDYTAPNDYRYKAERKE